MYRNGNLNPNWGEKLLSYQQTCMKRITASLFHLKIWRYCLKRHKISVLFHEEVLRRVYKIFIFEKCKKVLKHLINIVNTVS